MAASKTPRSASEQATGQPSEGADNSDTTYDRLQQLIPSRSHNSVRAIAELLEEYTEAWQASEAFDKLSEAPIAEFFVFSLNLTLAKEKMLIFTVPLDVVEQLASSRPHHVQDRSWLVMFYSIAIHVVEHGKGHKQSSSTLSKLRKNLWKAFNDVRLLIEPSPARTQALIILATYVEEFMTPCVCWSLITKACTMLQALGIIHWRLDSAASDLRTLLFWRLNMLDKALALILCRTPTFHREMANEIPLPALNKLVHSQPNRTTDSAPPALFEAHYCHQMHLFSRIMADVWHALYGQDTEKVLAVKERLELWYQQAKEVIEAAALVEKPLLTANKAASMDLGLQTLHFQYLSLLVLLTVSSRQLRSQSTQPSQEMLNLLPKLGDAVSDQRGGPYACLLWQYLHCPLAAFGALWGEIVIKTTTNLEQSLKSLEAIEHLPLFLGKLASRNALAARLQSITARIVEQARMILNSHGRGASPPTWKEDNRSHGLGYC
ncbi:hypothetical protein E4U43_004394 [Claviceps pusilla]|uniref:Xylanolytic transcriptional activator regulatory domain-containing protein n=1 Tax=Claviceps pusilla TaxID=123648 RepID=A0A9P7N3Z6_9HYPO|nr:hypothetical protein E4U43_004394 [Claviceps pusilla]